MLQLWFVNVGHGDCTIIKFPSGRVMMVDINNSKTLDKETANEIFGTALTASTNRVTDPLARLASLLEARKSYEDLLEDPIDVLKRECPGSDVFRFVATHPDMDHLTGLYRLSRQEPGIDILNFWDTANKKPKPEEFKADEDERDWDEYQRLRRSTQAPKALFLYRGSTGNYWTDDGVTILSPTPTIVNDANANEDWNHLSYVVQIAYGACSVILTGDATVSVQEELVDVFGNGLRSTILKAPHHGRDSGYCGEFVKAVSPDYTIVSVGKKPETDASNKYRQYSKKVYSTRFQGTIHAQLWPDGTVRMYDHAGTRIDIDADKERARAALVASLIGGPRR